MVESRGLAASGVAVVAFFMAVVLPAATWPLIDGDVWWHLRAGQEVLDTGTVPRVDTWSILGQGREWISQDWLTNALMAAVRSVGAVGDTLLSFGFGLLVVAAFVVLWLTIGIRDPSVRWAARLGWLALGLVAAAPILGVRVQVVDLLMSAVVAWVLARYVSDRRRRWLVALPVVAALWANLHAGWPILFLLGGAQVVGDGFDRWRKRPVRPAALTRAELRDLTLALVAAFGALALNPNGTTLWTYPLTTVGIAVLGQHIVEWFPVTANPYLLAVWVVLVLVAVVPTLAFGGRNLRLADALVVVGLVIMAGYAVRFLLIAGPLIAVIAAATVTPRLAATGRGGPVREVVDRLAVRRAGRLGLAHVAFAAVLVVIGMGISLAKVTPSAQAAVAVTNFPAEAVEWLEANDPGQRVFNRYEWGGYVGHERPDRLVFVDGRADLYGEDLLAEYAAIISLEVDPQAELDRHQIDHVLFSPASALGGWMDASHVWARAYSDPLAAVWVRR